MVITDLKSNNKKYSIIYADPPWEQKRRLGFVGK